MEAFLNLRGSPVACSFLDSPSSPVEAAPPDGWEQAGCRSGGFTMRTVKILVVSKDAELRDSLSRLSIEGKLRIETICTQSATQAVSMAHEEDIRLVAIDDTVANGTLAGVARKCRSAQRELSVVCVVSRPDAALEIELRRLGVLYVAVRPVSVPTLQSVVRTAIDIDTRRQYRAGTPPVGVPALPAEFDMEESR